MELKLKRKEIRERHFQTGGMIVLTILGLVGAMLVFFSGIFNVRTIDMLYECVSQNGIMIIFGLFFFGIFLYCFMLYFLNIIMPPRRDVVYFCEDKKYFISKKGKKIVYDENDVKENGYYYVLKTRDYIYEVLEKTDEDWIPKEKKSYWMNFYTPIGNFEDIMLLPIVYVILLPGLLSFIMSNGYEKIYGLIINVVPFYIIGYDLIYKIKLKKSSDNIIDGEFFYKSYEMLKNGILVIAAVAVCLAIIRIFFKLEDSISKLVFSPFLGCGLCTVGLVVAKTLKNHILENIFLKGYIAIFLIYWFGFTGFWTIGIVKQEGDFVYALFSIPFWIAGLFIMYKYFIKNKKEKEM